VLLPFTWAGPYFGLNIGGQFTNDSVSTASFGPAFFAGEAQSLDAMSPGTVTSKGAVGGMQAGYNWEFDKAVVGLEVDSTAQRRPATGQLSASSTRRPAPA
jgi:outer membrane immunogenic protein